ncbi:hypothetical protein SEVIR_6G058700v4 [Setaria viridis]|uniref:Uncharacterized protein n=1 Tax=Setaria viridis TaxID=4556 RepID=A0A4U6U5I4_SETVI|nr:putative F-box/FBD/LRR-repeat protein At5g56810 [Setaria viridis]TKW08953.1 hypothetical protein SEVIR_6G058700v2 [Setaria viridis]
MDAVITRSKRQRLEEESRRQQQRPPPAPRGEEGDAQRLDLIGRLPDDVLGAVITLLPATDGARTQILSRRWRPLWRSAPLNLEAKNLAAAQAILGSHHGGPGRRFSLTCCSDRTDGYPVINDDMLRPPGLDGLQEFCLRLHFSFPIAVALKNGRRNPATAPLSVFRFSATLRVLTIICFDHGGLEFPAESAAACGTLGFPRLEQLTLSGVSISECTLHGILSRCLVLQSLLLQDNLGYRRLRISSSTLRSLGVSDLLSRERMLEEVIIEDAPLLASIITDGLTCVRGLKIRVIQAPKLKVLGYLGDRVNEPMLGSMIFKNMKLVSLPQAMRTVKILALKVASDNLDAVIDFLTWFPCVAKLHMLFSSGNSWKDVWGKSNNARDLVSLEHLKTLELISYRACTSEVGLIRFFLSNARVLESLKVLADRRVVCDVDWIPRQHKRLRRIGTAASQGVKICLEPEPIHQPSSYEPMNHVHNLALDDPFGI